MTLGDASGICARSAEVIDLGQAMPAFPEETRLHGSVGGTRRIIAGFCRGPRPPRARLAEPLWILAARRRAAATGRRRPLETPEGGYCKSWPAPMTRSPSRTNTTQLRHRRLRCRVHARDGMYGQRRDPRRSRHNGRDRPGVDAPGGIFPGCWPNARSARGRTSPRGARQHLAGQWRMVRGAGPRESLITAAGSPASRVAGAQAFSRELIEFAARPKRSG